MNSFNSFQSFVFSIHQPVSYIYNYPSLDPSLVLYYPLDISSISNKTPNYGSLVSNVPTDDASLVGTNALITTTTNAITGLGDLSLNNIMGGTATNYVIANNSFTLNQSEGLTISCWFSTTGITGQNGTLISLPYNGNQNGIEIYISETNTINGIVYLHS